MGLSSHFTVQVSAKMGTIYHLLVGINDNPRTLQYWKVRGVFTFLCSNLTDFLKKSVQIPNFGLTL